MRLTKGEIAALYVVLVFAAACVVAWCIASGRTDLHSAWPDSAEFSQLMTGQERFSEHATNADGLTVVVDHETGVQYLVTSTGACPLLDVDGTPLLVAEAGVGE